MVCKNDQIAELEHPSGPITYHGDDTSVFLKKNNALNITFEPEFVSIPATSESLRRVFEIFVSARDSDGFVIDTCTLQFRPKGKLAY